ncbi:MAG: hypothetical protein V4578_16790 [Pseudomonadota bacterium]
MKKNNISLLILSGLIFLSGNTRAAPGASAFCLTKADITGAAFISARFKSYDETLKEQQQAAPAKFPKAEVLNAVLDGFEIHRNYPAIGRRIDTSGLSREAAANIEEDAKALFDRFSDDVIERALQKCMRARKK